MKINSENIILPGAIGALEACIDSLLDPLSRGQYIAICCHPHPQHGGAMGNKVIYTASRTLASLGVVSIRFNFRGVGKSEGEYAEGIGEQDDLLAVVNWCKQQYPSKKMILCGFSFGSHITAIQASKLKVNGLISIAPPIGRIDLIDKKGLAFERPDCPWLIIQGDDDELVDATKVAEWAASFERQPSIIKMPGTTHFFHGKLPLLRTHIEGFIKEAITL